MKILSETVYSYVSSVLPSMTGNYLEIGVFNGTGFASIASANFNKTCYAIDPFIEDGHTVMSSGHNTGSYMSQQKQNYLDNTKDLRNCILHEMTSAEYAEKLTDQLCQDMYVSVVTVDGDHHYPHVVIDLNLALRLIGNKTGIIVVDDTDVADVFKACQEFLDAHSDRISHMLEVGGSTKAIIIKEKNDAH